MKDLHQSPRVSAADGTNYVCLENSFGYKDEEL